MSLDDLFKELDEIEEKPAKKAPKMNVAEVSPFIVEEIKIPTRQRKSDGNLRLQKTFEIPDFNDILKFCEKHLDDYEIEQFYKHSIPRRLHKKKYQEDRGGGGWSGAVKATINVFLKMKKEGVL